jgi:hypothetical protein
VLLYAPTFLIPFPYSLLSPVLTHIHAHTRIHTNTHTHTPSTNTHTHSITNTHAHTHIHAHAHTHIHNLTHAHTELDAKKAAYTVSYFNVLCGADPEADSSQKAMIRKDGGHA